MGGGGGSTATRIMDIAMVAVIGAAVIGAFARPDGLKAAVSGIGGVVTKTLGILSLQPNAGG